MKLCKGAVLLLGGVAVGTLAAPLANQDAHPLMPAQRMDTRLHPRSTELVYNNADILQTVTAFHKYLDQFFHIGLDLVGSINGFDGAKLLEVIKGFKVKAIVDYYRKTFDLPDITGLLRTAKSVNIGIFLPAVYKFLKTNKVLNNPAVSKAIQSQSLTGKTILDAVRNINGNPFALALKSPDFIKAYKTVTGVDPTQALTNVASIKGSAVLNDFSASTGADLVQTLEASGITQYLRDVLGLDIQSYLDTISGMSGADIIAWFESIDFGAALKSVQPKAGTSLVDNINNAVNGALDAVRKFVTSHIKVKGVNSAAQAPTYTGFDFLKHLNVVHDFTDKLVGFKTTEPSVILQDLDLEDLHSKLTSLTGAKIGTELEAMFKKMGKKKQEELLKWGVNEVYKLWNWFYTLDGKKILAIAKAATLPKTKEYLSSLDITELPNIVLKYDLTDFVVSILGVNLKPIVQDLAKLNMPTLLKNINAVTGDDLVQLLSDMDVWNYLSGFNIHIDPLISFVKGLSGAWLDSFLTTHDGPWLINTLSTLKGPAIVDIVNKYLNEALSLVVDVVRGPGVGPYTTIAKKAKKQTASAVPTAKATPTVAVTPTRTKKGFLSFWPF